MKTLKQHNNDIALTTRAREESAAAERLRKLEAIETMRIEPYGSTDGDKSDYNALRLRARNMIRNNDGCWAALACDNCGVELWREAGMNFCASATYTVRCAGCGFIGYTR